MEDIFNKGKYREHPKTYLWIAQYDPAFIREVLTKKMFSQKERALLGIAKAKLRQRQMSKEMDKSLSEFKTPPRKPLITPEMEKRRLFREKQSEEKRQRMERYQRREKQKKETSMARKNKRQFILNLNEKTKKIREENERLYKKRRRSTIVYRDSLSQSDIQQLVNDELENRPLEEPNVKRKIRKPQPQEKPPDSLFNKVWNTVIPNPETKITVKKRFKDVQWKVLPLKF
tara:strand:- start:481 stop:1170 length:690 start_codon:yes stop_codon:yes gene_type:complete